MEFENKSNKTLFLGDLSVYCGENDIQQYFSVYGMISSIIVMRNELTKKSRCFGFITFESTESTIKALNEMDGVIICGRKLR
jgi:RNA recognition motif-containing protein